MAPREMESPYLVRRNLIKGLALSKKANGSICPSSCMIREKAFNEGKAKENKPLSFSIALFILP